METLHTSRAARQLDDLDEALAWMASLGIEVDPGRLAAYRKIAEKWDDFADGHGKLGLRELAPIVATFAYEVTGFIAVHQTFRDLPLTALAGLAAWLDAAARGPIRIDGARSAAPDPARAGLFKAVSAAYVQQAADGGKVALDAASGAAFAHGRHHLTVVAERLDAQGSIEAGLAKASGPLVQVLDGRQGARQRGLIALDASALLKPATQLPPAGTQSAMDHAADQRLANYIDARMDGIQACLQGLDRRLIGVMVLLSSVAVGEDGRDFFHVGRWALVWRDRISFSDFDLLDRMRSQLRGEG